MPYTVWSRGRLLGESELAYRRTWPRFRAGDFAPTPLGESLMSIIDGVGPALRALYEVTETDRQLHQDGDSPNGWPARVRRTTEYADAVSIGDELESLDLELRDPSGAVVKTDWISIRDLEQLLAAYPEGEDDTDIELTEEDQQAVDEMVAEFEALPWDDDPEPWQGEPKELPRYQIMVGLAGFERWMKREAARKRE